MEYSVLMSVYKKEQPEWLEISLLSVINQTHKPNEIVIVKDGELTEDLENILEKYISINSNIFKVISLKQNIGLGLALKIGVENCNNEWIMRMDTDDYCVPERVQKQFEILKIHNDLDLIGTNVEEFIETTKNVVSHVVLPETNEQIISFAKKRCPFRHPSMLIKKSKLIEAGNYREYYLCEDYDLWVRMLQNGAKAYNIQESLVYMRISKDFYKRRGGIKYLKSILKFKKELYNKNFYSLNDLIISGGTQIIFCLVPNVLREFLYKKFLRKN